MPSNLRANRQSSALLAGYAIAKRALSRENKPSAVFCTTDELAYGFFKRCSELGINVPSELHIFGFDGNPLNGYLAPWLSTIRVPYENFGEAVTRKLEQQWSQDSHKPVTDAIFAFAQTIAVDKTNAKAH